MIPYKSTRALWKFWKDSVKGSGNAFLPLTPLLGIVCDIGGEAAVSYHMEKDHALLISCKLPSIQKYLVGGLNNAFSCLSQLFGFSLVCSWT